MRNNLFIGRKNEYQHCNIYIFHATSEHTSLTFKITYTHLIVNAIYFWIGVFEFKL